MENADRLGFAAVVSALNAHGRLRVGDSEEDVVLAAIELDNETDRGAVILAAAAFEDKLTARILHEFQPLNSREKADLFDFDRPLGSFSAKIRIAHAMGILDRPLKRIAEVVRVMRNACAHSGSGTAFIDEPMLMGLDFILQEFGYRGDELHLRSDGRPDWPRFLFLTAINILTVNVDKDTAGKDEPQYSQIYQAYVSYKAASEEWLRSEQPTQSPQRDHPSGTEK